MAWVRLEDTFPEHPKIDAAGGDAGWLHVCALAYCNRNLTDGFIAQARIGRLSDRKSPAQLAQRLVDVGLWEPCDSGWVIHDYLHYNPSKEQVDAQRAARSEVKQKAGHLGGIASGVARRKHNRSRDEAEQEANGKQNDVASEAPTRPDPITGVASLEKSSSARTPPAGRTDKKRTLNGHPPPPDDERLPHILDCYASHAWNTCNQSAINNPGKFRESKRREVLDHPELARFLREYPTARASEIAGWLHGDRNTMRYHERHVS